MPTLTVTPRDLYIRYCCLRMYAGQYPGDVAWDAVPLTVVVCGSWSAVGKAFLRVRWQLTCPLRENSCRVAMCKQLQNLATDNWT